MAKDDVKHLREWWPGLLSLQCAFHAPFLAGPPPDDQADPATLPCDLDPSLRIDCRRRRPGRPEGAGGYPDRQPGKTHQPFPPPCPALADGTPRGHPVGFRRVQVRPPARG